MSKFREGDKIENSTLYVIKYVSSNRVRCGCSKCNKKDDTYVSMVYNELTLLKGGVSCRFCTEIEKAEKSGLYKEKDFYMKVLTRSSSTLPIFRVGDDFVLTCRGDFDPDQRDLYPFGVRYGDLISIAYYSKIKKIDEYGVHCRKPSHIVLKCESCEYIKFVPLKDVGKTNHVCPLCFELKNKMKLQIKMREEHELKRNIESSQARDFKCKKTLFSNIATNIKMQNNVKSLEAKNPSYKVVDIERDKGGTKYHLVCKTCGSVVTCMRIDKKFEECSFCKSKGDNDKGYLFRDYVGSVFNGLKVISQEDFTCEVECVKCKKRKKGVDLYKVLSRGCYCDCKMSVISTECPNCLAPLKELSYGDIYSGKMPICSKCGEKIDDNVYIATIKGLDYANSLKAKLRMLNDLVSSDAERNIKLGYKDAVESLVVEREPIYNGNDDKSYFRCVCRNHNVGLLLSEDEIKNYKCEYCNDTRQGIIADTDADLINLT